MNKRIRTPTFEITEYPPSMNGVNNKLNKYLYYKTNSNFTDSKGIYNVTFGVKYGINLIAKII